MEDYTGKYKGEQVEVALFGGEYQEGVLTAYCYVDEVAHIELNGHILVPLQNIASLHCSSRCDAQANEDWPPRGLLDDDGPNGSGPEDRTTRSALLLAARNVAKAWLLLIGLCGVLAFVGWSIGGVRLLSIFVFCALLLVGRRVLDVRPRRARDGARARAADRARRRSSTRRSSGSRRGPASLKPKLYLIPDGLPLALATGRGPAYSAIALSSGLRRRVPAGGARGRDRARARAREASRRRTADGGRRARCVD